MGNWKRRDADGPVVPLPVTARGNRNRVKLANGSDGPVLRAKLVLREFLGQIQRLHATLPDGTQIRISTIGSLQVAAAAGTELAFAYDPAQIIVYPGS